MQSPLRNSDSAQPHVPNQDIKNILVFVHGFLGTEESFQDFPAHLQARLSGYESLLFPAFNCQHSINEASVRLVAYLKAHQTNTNKDLQIILIAHSMGGLVIADATKLLVTEIRIKVHAIVCFDTPFFHLNPAFVSAGYSAITNNPLTNMVMGSSGSVWSKVAALTIPTLLSAVYISQFVSKYIDFLTPLFAESFTQRLNRIQSIVDGNIRFACFYPKLDSPSLSKPRTFIYIPDNVPSHISALFHPIQSVCSDALQSHTHIFDTQTNPIAYGQLVADVVELIRSWDSV